MGVVQGFTPMWRPSSRGTLDVVSASLFLRAQSSWLCRGLERAADPTATGIVLGAHDASHESWLDLIATVQRCRGDEPAQQIAALYGFHGRVVGSLERGLDRSLDPGVAASVRELLGERLQVLTERAVTILSSDEPSTAIEALPG